MRFARWLAFGLWAAAGTACARGADGLAAAPKAEAPKRVREATVAGRFYPGTPEALSAQVRSFLEGWKKTARAPVRMLLVPHAGYDYSGKVAAAAFRQLDPGFERVVILAANHNGEADFTGLSPDRATHYRVPGLEVKVAAATAELLGKPGFVDVPAAHTMHMVEVELPFLWAVNGKPFEIVPVVVGRLSRAGLESAVQALDALWEPKTIVVVSVDLSHYHPYDQAVGFDRPCLEALERMDLEAAARCNTDGTQVLLLMARLAARRSLTPTLVTYANSGDVSQDRSRVVGYGAMAFEDRFELNPAEQAELLRLARRALEASVNGAAPVDPSAELVARWPRLAAPRGAFVTLKKSGALRGCIGSLAAQRPLAADVVANAVNAAVADPRFPPVRPEELGAIDVSISVLDAPRPYEGPRGDGLLQRLGETRPGLILTFQGRRSTFLPEVWEELPEPTHFLGHLCAKQGSPQECWRSPEARVEVYGSQHFGEPQR